MLLLLSQFFVLPCCALRSHRPMWWIVATLRLVPWNPQATMKPSALQNRRKRRGRRLPRRTKRKVCVSTAAKLLLLLPPICLVGAAAMLLPPTAALMTNAANTTNTNNTNNTKHHKHHKHQTPRQPTDGGGIGGGCFLLLCLDLLFLVAVAGIIALAVVARFGSPLDLVALLIASLQVCWAV
jgi:hypothetical protein